MTGAVTADGWSAYDESVPHTTGLPEVVDRTAQLRALRHPVDGVSLDDVRRVVVVVSSSRGGSSLFSQLLRRVPALLHLRAEVNPLFTLAGLHDGAERRRVLEEELLRDIGTPVTGGELGAEARSRLVLDLAWRLTVQWPALTGLLHLQRLLTLVDEEVPTAGRRYDAAAVHVSLLTRLRQLDAPVDPRYYDLPPSSLDPRQTCRAGAPPPAGPPGDAVIEMPPFVAVDCWRPASVDRLRSQPLVICTPRCAFRLEFLRDLFPTAQLKVLHLTRNPAASVNGLIDGWRHHGFFNCPVPGGLAIDGYSDEVPGGTEWWCFDVPPGWEDRTSAALEEVCAFQWQATNRAALDGCGRLGVRPLRLRFEDVVGPTDARLRVSRELAALLEVDGTDVEDALRAKLPVVMATAPPVPARWRSRREVLARVLEDPAVLDVADRLGYGRDRSGWV